MTITTFERFVTWLVRLPRHSKASISQTKSAPSLLEIDPFWHGDHWQNLLASPMDARHYVMEDWALPFADESEPAYIAASKERRNHRRSH